MRLLMCKDMDIRESNKIPKFLTVVTGVTTLSPILRTTDDGSFRSPWEVPAMKNSVFVGLSFNMFVGIQSLKSVMQCSSWQSAARLSPLDLGLKEKLSGCHQPAFIPSTARILFQIQLVVQAVTVSRTLFLFAGKCAQLQGTLATLGACREVHIQFELG